MKRILLSVAIIAAVAAVAITGTRALFTDEEVATGNVFEAGTIDIAVDGQNPWEADGQYTIADMKPCYTDYIEFEIEYNS